MSENLVTMVFTDLVSSTAIKLQLPGSDITESNRLYRDTILLPHRHRVEASLPAYGGRKVETIGDAFFVVFSRAMQAVQWAVAIQMSHISDPISTPLGPLQISVGMHTGSPLADDDRFIGHEVDYAARVAALATKEQILLSEVTAVLVRQAHLAGMTLHRHDDRNLKGIGIVPIFELLYNQRQPQPLKDRSNTPEVKNNQPDISIFKKALSAQTKPENLTSPPENNVSTASPLFAIPTDIQKQLQTLLAASIGPIATLIIEEALKEVSSVQDLVEKLVVKVPEASRKQFQEQAKKLLETPMQTFPVIPDPPPLLSVSSPKISVAKNPKLVPVEPNFLKLCETELAKAIGPMAILIVQQTISLNPEVSANQLVEILAKQIPIPQKAQEFRQSLLI